MIVYVMCYIPSWLIETLLLSRVLELVVYEGIHGAS